MDDKEKIFDIVRLNKIQDKGLSKIVENHIKDFDEDRINMYFEEVKYYVNKSSKGRIADDFFYLIFLLSKNIKDCISSEYISNVMNYIIEKDKLPDKVISFYFEKEFPFKLKNNELSIEGINLSKEEKDYFVGFIREEFNEKTFGNNRFYIDAIEGTMCVDYHQVSFIDKDVREEEIKDHLKNGYHGAYTKRVPLIDLLSWRNSNYKFNEKRLDFLEKILSKGGNPNIREKYGRTPLFCIDDKREAEILIRYGANTGALYKGITPAEYHRKEYLEHKFLIGEKQIADYL